MSIIISLIPVLVTFQAVASLGEKERELDQRNALVTMLTQDRDRALGTLKKHGIKVSHNVDVRILV